MQKGMHRAISSTVTSFAGLQIQQKHYTSLIVKINSEVFCSSKVDTMASFPYRLQESHLAVLSLTAPS